MHCRPAARVTLSVHVHVHQENSPAMLGISVRRGTVLPFSWVKPVPFIFYGDEQPTALSRTAMDVHFLLRILQVAVNHRVPYGFKKRKLHVLLFASDTLRLRAFSHQTVDATRNRFDAALYAPAKIQLAGVEDSSQWT